MFLTCQCIYVCVTMCNACTSILNVTHNRFSWGWGEEGNLAHNLLRPMKLLTDGLCVLCVYTFLCLSINIVVYITINRNSIQWLLELQSLLSHFLSKPHRLYYTLSLMIVTMCIPFSVLTDKNTLNRHVKYTPSTRHVNRI